MGPVLFSPMLQRLTLADATASAGLTVRRAAEIGVFSYGDSVIKEYCERGIRCDFYEAVPRFCEHIAADLRELPNAHLFRFAVTDRDGTVDLHLAGLVGGSTFSADQPVSPAVVNDGFRPVGAERLTVPCRDFATVDPGDYDVVSIDVEGGEWPVLRRMRSRPLVLAIETHSRKYVNPHLDEIVSWCRDSGYRVWYLTKSDTVFFRGAPPGQPYPPRWKLRWRRWRLYGRRF